MQLLVDDLLEFSQVSRELQELESVNLADKLQKVLVDLELVIEEKKANIIVGALPVVSGNRRQLQQLLQNLVGNALKYSKPDVVPQIEISSEQVTGEGSGIRVSADDEQKLFHLIKIKDNGIGFEQQYAAKIFDIFTRLHGRSEYTGTGVGLAIVQKVVQNHNGYIVAEAMPGVGATFNLLLPAQ